MSIWLFPGGITYKCILKSYKTCKNTCRKYPIIRFNKYFMKWWKNKTWGAEKDKEYLWSTDCTVASNYSLHHLLFYQSQPTVFWIIENLYPQALETVHASCGCVFSLAVVWKKKNSDPLRNQCNTVSHGYLCVKPVTHNDGRNEPTQNYHWLSCMNHFSTFQLMVLVHFHWCHTGIGVEQKAHKTLCWAAFGLQQRQSQHSGEHSPAFSS